MNWIEEATKNAALWSSDFFDETTRTEVKNILKDDELLVNSFAENLSFGTGGMRGIMGVGTNRINKYTLGKITQGLANFINQTQSNKEKKVVLAHDVRHNSKAFCQLIADVLSANGITVYIFDDFRPTPLLSYAVRALSCTAGIVLTASHNPPEYNGYKVYWDDGGQIVPPLDTEIVKAIDKVKFEEVLFKENPDLVKVVPTHVDEDYIAACVQATRLVENLDRSQLKIVFTPIHGTSVHLLPKMLCKSGFSDLHIVEKQAEPNGDFPTVVSPNPEEPEALKMATELAVNMQADILMGTDPDADRLGIGVRNYENNFVLLNGNQTNTIITYFLLDYLKEKNALHAGSFIGSTIVSSEIFPALAKHFDVKCKLGLTGFKWIAKMIKDAKENEEFICGGEESYGALVGDFVRDKDALSAAAMLCEIACSLKAKNQNLLTYLDFIYEKVGFFHEDLISIKKEGIKGKEEINGLMSLLRKHPPKKISGKEVVFVEDYKDNPTRKNMKTNSTEKIHIESADVLIFITNNNSRIAIRPSGTEPKIKFYMGCYVTVEETLVTAKTKAEESLRHMQLEIENWMS